MKTHNLKNIVLAITMLSSLLVIQSIQAQKTPDNDVDETQSTAISYGDKIKEMLKRGTLIKRVSDAREGVQTIVCKS